VSWIRETLIGEGKIAPGDLDLLWVVDDPDEVVRLIQEAHRNGQAFEPAVARDGNRAPAPGRGGLARPHPDGAAPGLAARKRGGDRAATGPAALPD